MSVKFSPRKRKTPTKADRERARNLLRSGGEKLRESEKQRKQEKHEPQATQTEEPPRRAPPVQAVEGKRR